MAKPLLFGDATFDAARIDEARRIESEWDRSYVPGYSELRRENELRVRAGQKPISHDRLQWIRIGHVDGTDVGNKDMLEWAFLGYQFATAADLEERGWEMPPTAHVDAAGRIRREDAALVIVSAEIAAKNAARQVAKNADFHATVGANAPSHIEVTENVTHRLASLSDVANYKD